MSNFDSPSEDNGEHIDSLNSSPSKDLSSKQTTFFKANGELSKSSSFNHEYNSIDDYKSYDDQTQEDLANLSRKLRSELRSLATQVHDRSQRNLNNNNAVVANFKGMFKKLELVTKENAQLKQDKSLLDLKVQSLDNMVEQLNQESNYVKGELIVLTNKLQKKKETKLKLVNTIKSKESDIFEVI